MTHSTTQKHLGMLLDVKLDFQGHLKNIYSKFNKTIGLLRKLHNTLPRLPLITIYKSFVRPHLDYGDMIYDQIYTASIRSIQLSISYFRRYKRDISRETLSRARFENPEKRRWYRKLCCFFKIFKKQSSKYLFIIILASVRPCNSRNANNISQFKVKHLFP